MELIELEKPEITNDMYYYSASENMFIVLRESENVNIHDAVEIDYSTYTKMNSLPSHLMLASNENGLPISVPVGTYYYSAIDNAFYPFAMQSIYLKAGTWPKNGIQVDEAIYQEFAINEPPRGKQRTANKKGLPAWADIPPPTSEQLITEAEQQKQSLLTEANSSIAPLQDAVDLGMATDEEKAQLTSWKTYRVLLNRVDTSLAPNIEWPEKPE
ncbi:Bacteriophage tail assembly protein [Acinetobacter baumannii]|uniref:tail fiber assembly protein n=1 Tax=Providencia stuartii TaxID=588 RepID=UPI000DE5DA04|nr:tail fiber assembly protein [Providencia stuartii]MDQ5989782.1 tail fiber assembly protein [Providencia stuartii]SST02769.1 Bacteriophage tail assembly protein [Acinetobacter baumannii]